MHPRDDAKQGERRLRQRETGLRREWTGSRRGVVPRKSRLAGVRIPSTVWVLTAASSHSPSLKLHTAWPSPAPILPAAHRFGGGTYTSAAVLRIIRAFSLRQPVPSLLIHLGSPSPLLPHHPRRAAAANRLSYPASEEKRRLHEAAVASFDADGGEEKGGAGGGGEVEESTGGWRLGASGVSERRTGSWEEPR